MRTGRPCAQANWLSAPVPRPRLHLIRLHGVLAPSLTDEARLRDMGMRHGSGRKLAASSRQARRAVNAGLFSARRSSRRQPLRSCHAERPFITPRRV
jgi:hypothetical protein